MLSLNLGLYCRLGLCVQNSGMEPLTCKIHSTHNGLKTKVMYLNELASGTRSENNMYMVNFFIIHEFGKLSNLNTTYTYIKYRKSHRTKIKDIEFDLHRIIFLLNIALMFWLGQISYSELTWTYEHLLPSYCTICSVSTKLATCPSVSMPLT